jgi:hypothetical protein
LNFLVIALGLLALALVGVMRAPKRIAGPGSAIFAVCGFCAAFVVTLALVRLSHDQSGLGRVSDYDGFVAHAVQATAANDASPVILFVGSSISRNAVDDVAMNADFAAAGSSFQAINLSLEGASYFERLSRIKRYVRLAGEAPDMVFLEFNHAYDARPAYVFRVGKFSERAVDQFGPRASLFTAQGIAARACEGLKGCVLDAGLLPFHALMNLTNLGLANVAAPFADAPPKPSFERIDFRKETVDTDARIAGLSAVDTRADGDAFAWASAYRAYQRAQLHALGVRQIGYYSPAVISPEERAYAAHVCQTELAGFVCIVGDDPALLSALNRDVWSDKEHLMNEGAEIFSHWFSAQVMNQKAQGAIVPLKDRAPDLVDSQAPGTTAQRAPDPADLALRPKHEVSPT